MGDEKKEARRLSDGDFWDMAALDALQGLASNSDVRVDSHKQVSELAATYADHLLAERHKRRESGAT